jgi:ABC-2 type transport system permease protein
MALNDLRLTARDRTSFVWMLVMPIAMMWFFGGIGGSSSDGEPRITLTLENRDDGWLSRALVVELEDERLVLRELTDELREQGAVRTLVVPEGFTDGVLAGEQQVLRLVKEADSDESFGMAAQAHITRSLVRTIGRLVEMDDLASPDAEALFLALGERPALVNVEVSSAGRGRSVPSGFAQSVPGNLTFLVLMMTLIYGAVFLTIERTEGMLRRQMVLPMSRRRVFLGKLAGRLLMSGLQIIVLILAGRFLFEISFGNSLPALALLLGSFALAVAGLATLLGSVTKTPGQASSIGWLGSMVMAAMGGCWWPAELMPPWMRTVAHAMPTAWAMDGFHALISFGQGLPAVLVPSLVLAAFGLLSSTLAARLLRI